MYTLQYKPSFIRQYKRIPENLKEEVKERIALLKEDPSHPYLKTHKLKGRLQGHWSSSVNFSYRIIFIYEKPNIITLLALGNHDVYK